MLILGILLFVLYFLFSHAKLLSTYSPRNLIVLNTQHKERLHKKDEIDTANANPDANLEHIPPACVGDTLGVTQTWGSRLVCTGF